MTDIEIVSPVPDDEFAGWTANLWRTFLNPPNPEAIERSASFWRGRLSLGRSWGARVDGQWVATLGSETRTLSVPSGDGATRPLDVHALTAVTTSATHRRLGLLSRMLDESLRSGKEEGLPLSILVAAEWPIYGRFGYGPAVRMANYEYRPRQPRAAITPSGRGQVQHIDAAEVARVGPEMFDRSRGARAGQVDRPGFWWRRELDERRPDRATNYVVHRTAGEVDGLLSWSPEGDFDLDGSLAGVRVDDLDAVTPDAYRDLWAYLAGIDAVDRITLHLRPVDEPVRWLLGDGRALRETYAGDHVWVRLLDVPAALSARGYATSGRVVLDVVDDADRGYARGRYVLDATADGATCAPTTENADIRLPATALASAYLGGYRLRPLALAGLVEELTPGSLERLNTMFATSLEPWCATGF